MEISFRNNFIHICRYIDLSNNHYKYDSINQINRRRIFSNLFSIQTENVFSTSPIKTVSLNRLNLDKIDDNLDFMLNY